jgi:hypothetical protein
MTGQHTAAFYAYFAAMAAIGVTGLEPVSGRQDVARHAGWWWCYRYFSIITDRPELLERDEQGRLHSDRGMAVRYRDGWGVHAWHGRRVPAWVITGPGIEQIAAEWNVEIRRCAMESMGWERFLAEARGASGEGEQWHATAPDPGNPGQQLALYDVPERLWGSRVRLLLRANGLPERDGTHRKHAVAVPAEISDPVEAAAWAAGLTRDEYARLARRT